LRSEPLKITAAAVEVLAFVTQANVCFEESADRVGERALFVHFDMQIGAVRLVMACAGIEVLGAYDALVSHQLVNVMALLRWG
jgi:hypothetical protein